MFLYFPTIKEVILIESEIHNIFNIIKDEYVGMAVYFSINVDLVVGFYSPRDGFTFARLKNELSDRARSFFDRIFINSVKKGKIGIGENGKKYAVNLLGQRNYFGRFDGLIK
ncbi:hypothetical protein U1839_26525 [Sphingomonas sp. RT2P30]|uniref:hypothetical protein n=1 Tax=Parasphingomonas halimpatiens TaxID=3096162 RepID=UPI002FC8AA48